MPPLGECDTAPPCTNAGTLPLPGWCGCVLAVIFVLFLFAVFVARNPYDKDERDE
jgi:hypothetical protein